MSHVRADLRTAVRTALQAAMPDINWPRRWWVKVAPSELPRGGVATPLDVPRRIDVDEVERAVDLLVMLKRTGGDDLDDVLDADSAGVEETVMPVLAQHSDLFDLVETTTDFDQNAEEPLGSLSMRFRVILRTPEGAPE